MYKNYIKRLFDILFSVIALPIFIIIFIPVSILIYREDKGSIFFSGKRLGKDMKEFKMIKFRSMKVNAPDIRNEDGSTFNSDKDPRQTKIGRILRKTSIDEIPQIINVLKGDMSIVGPRPSPLGNKERYSKEYLKKFSVKPGITGLNQAYLRNASTMEERIYNDIKYVNELSFFLDVKIIFKTISTVLFQRGINRNTK